MNGRLAHHFSDEGIRVTGTLVGFSIMALGFLLALSIPTSFVEHSRFWLVASYMFSYVSWGAVVLAVTARTVGLSRRWVLPVTGILAVVALAVAIRAVDAGTINSGFETGAWGGLMVMVQAASSLGLLVVLGTGRRDAALLGLALAAFVAIGGAAMAGHAADRNPFWSDAWVFVGRVDSYMGSAFVLTAASLTTLAVCPGQLRRGGLAFAGALLITGGAYGIWYVGRVPANDGWFLSFEWTATVSMALLVLVATDVIRRFEVIAILLIGLVIASVANATWIADQAEQDKATAFLTIALSFLTPVALKAYWWLLNERERRLDVGDGEPAHAVPGDLGYAEGEPV
jgi:hypothetical protein